MQALLDAYRKELIGAIESLDTAEFAKFTRICQRLTSSSFTKKGSLNNERMKDGNSQVHISRLRSSRNRTPKQNPVTWF